MLQPGLTPSACGGSSSTPPQELPQAFTVTRDAAGAVTRQAVEYALTRRTAVVLAIPYDLAALEAADEDLPEPTALEVTDDGGTDLARVARLLASARRPLILPGRGAHLAGAGQELRELADRLGALTAGTALALNLLKGEGYLGVAGGFGTDTAAGLMGEADVVLVAGASLSPFTLRFGHLLGPDSTVIQIDTALQPTNPRVDLFVQSDVKAAASQLLSLVEGGAAAAAWREEASMRLIAGPGHDVGSTETADGRLDPRALATALDAVLPERRTVVQDGGHFIGWAPMYWGSPRGGGRPNAGAGLRRRRLPDGSVRPRIVDRCCPQRDVVIYNDAAYGAEIHQYGSQGLTEKPMLIPEVDFSGVARALGAESAVIRSLSDLAALQDWIDAGARGTFVADCRITSTVRAPWLSEWMNATRSAKAAVSN
ncbi:thiamine pyrophosphate-binding protein [Arthrobacter nitrophenolicus]|uniref:thiamine pyrophosphate-binding protein n=1 Tax=Arthrobacter nitrophenolicus TaxID=683150 RepID=UPI001F117C78|nr:thiamine pyrophosphate-binding protein [Arthrobacter nitrophenolicus]